MLALTDGRRTANCAAGLGLVTAGEIASLD